MPTTPPSPVGTPEDRPGARPLLVIGTPGFDAWRTAEPAGHVLLVGPGAAIHQVSCGRLSTATGRVAVCSPDTVALQLAMYRFEGEVVGCTDCRPVLDAPAPEFSRTPHRA